MDLIWALLVFYLFLQGMFLQGIAVFLLAIVFVIYVERLIDKRRDHVWKAKAAMGQKIEAIKLHRAIHGSTLKESLDAVEAYLAKI